MPLNPAATPPMLFCVTSPAKSPVNDPERNVWKAIKYSSLSSTSGSDGFG